MWFKRRCWSIAGSWDRTTVAARIEDFLEEQRAHRRWPLVFSDRYSVSDSGFAVNPTLLFRNPYRFTLRGEFSSGDEPDLYICLSLGLGVFIEGFVVAAFALIALASLAMVGQSLTSKGSIDLSALLLAIPFLVVIVIAVAVRLWLHWRGKTFVNGLSAALVESRTVQAPSRLHV